MSWRHLPGNLAVTACQINAAENGRQQKPAQGSVFCRKQEMIQA